MPQQQADMSSMMMSLAAGAGWKNFTEGTKKMAESGQDMQSLMGLPNMPMFLAGNGFKDIANSLDLVKMLQQAMAPPQTPEPPPEQDTAAALAMLSANLGPGLQGMQAPTGGGMPSPGMGGGMMPPKPGMY
jgi:hypothetical protein